MIFDLNYRRFGLDVMLERKCDELFAKIDECENCRKCEQSCTYDLPIPEILQRLKAVYDPIIAAHGGK